MADETPSLHIDTDWKKQAQEEKKRLAEEQAKRAAAPAPAPLIAPPGAAPGGLSQPAATGGGRSRGQRAPRETPVASVATLVQSVLTQTLFYLGELASAGGEANINLDMAKYQLDTLGVIEDKTRNNLAPDEQHLLDTALYEARMRFVNVASQYL